MQTLTHILRLPPFAGGAGFRVPHGGSEITARTLERSAASAAANAKSRSARYVEAQGIIAKLIALGVTPVGNAQAVGPLRAQLASELKQRGVVGEGEEEEDSE